MGNHRKRTPGPQYHAEGQHGEKTHRRFIEMLTESAGARDDDNAPVERAHAEGQRRLQEDRQQHDEAEKGSEKVEAMREERRGAEIPHESDSA